MDTVSVPGGGSAKGGICTWRLAGGVASSRAAGRQVARGECEWPEGPGIGAGGFGLICAGRTIFSTETTLSKL